MNTLIALSNLFIYSGGIALGIDRLMSIICNTSSIRDVIAFPKGLEGKDALSKAPCEISEEEKKMYHIKTLEKYDPVEASEAEILASPKASPQRAENQ